MKYLKAALIGLISSIAFTAIHAGVNTSEIRSNNLNKVESKNHRSFRVGDQLVSLTQGVHKSVESGTYLGNGEYKIKMKDGGRPRHFTMHFKLTSKGNGEYTLDRLDCNDPQSCVTDVGYGLLEGGAFYINYR